MHDKIAVITGPESCGKTTLARQLSKHFNAPLVPEVARDYLNSKISKDQGFKYTEQDVLEIARQQHQKEQKTLTLTNEMLVCDTDLSVILIWHQYKYDTCPSWIIDTFLSQQHKYRHYFLCGTEIPWEPDPLRENSTDREQLLILYKNLFEQHSIPYSIISGQQTLRLEQTIDILDSL